MESHCSACKKAASTACCGGASIVWSKKTTKTEEIKPETLKLISTTELDEYVNLVLDEVDVKMTEMLSYLIRVTAVSSIDAIIGADMNAYFRRLSNFKVGDRVVPVLPTGIELWCYGQRYQDWLVRMAKLSIEKGFETFEKTGELALLRDYVDPALVPAGRNNQLNHYFIFKPDSISIKLTRQSKNVILRHEPK